MTGIHKICVTWLAFECYHSWPAAGGDDPAVHADVDGEEGEEDDEEDGEHADDHDLHRGQESSETWSQDEQCVYCHQECCQYSSRHANIIFNSIKLINNVGEEFLTCLTWTRKMTPHVKYFKLKEPEKS